MAVNKYFISFLFFLAALSKANAADPEAPAYWDFGLGVGAVHYEQYPAANQFADLALPAPTFQYRGKVLRADDRDGAHLYLLKETNLTLEFSGQGTPALDSSNNRARTGMENLPWMLALGPQLVYRGVESFEFAFGAYQAITTDFKMTKTSGNIFEGKVSYKWSFPFEAWGLIEEPGLGTGKLIFTIQGGTKDFLALYFGVNPQYATPDRPAYEAKEGLLSRDVSYFQTFKSGRGAVYVGASMTSYDISANRTSPLHKSDHNFTALIGFNYILTESSKPAISDEETSGLINNLKKNRNLKDYL